MIDSFIKHDNTKPRWSLFPGGVVEELLKVLEYGASKYEVDNWKKADPNDMTRLSDAAVRHLFQYCSGEKNDQESGLHHLAHAAINCCFIIWFDKRRSGRNAV